MDMDQNVYDEMPAWTFQVENFGYINKGALTLKPLTILCGQNNTGKTWMMYSMYGILRHLPTDEPLPEIAELTNKLLVDGYVEWNIVEWFERNFTVIQTYINQAVKQRLPEILNTEPEFFSETVFNFLISSDTSRLFQKGKTKGMLAPVIPVERFSVEKEHHSAIVKITLPNNRFKASDIENTIKELILDLIINKRMGMSPLLLPSERNGLHLLFRELSIRRTALLSLWRGNNENFSDLTSNISRYAEPIAHYINWLNHLGLNNQSKSFDDAIVEMNFLEKIIKGKLEVDKDNNIDFLLEGDQRLGLHLTSSTVNSLAGLWFYMKHTAREDYVLMIDEPELNLHPANQRALARLLARLVNKGIRIVISTHSDYLIREINSLIMLSQEHPQRADLMGKYGYSEAETLKPEQVGAYLFDKNSIQAMEVSQDEGIIATTFDEVINDLNETSDDIFYTYRHWNNKVEDAA